MSWCPKCKCEYVEGITECKKCGSTLVKELILPEQIIAVGNKDKLLKIRDTLQEKGFLSAEVVFEPGDEVYVLITNKEDHDDAKKTVVALTEKFKQEMMKKVKESAPASNNQPYQKASEKAEEMKSSAYTLLFVGLLGLVIDALFVFDLIMIHFTLMSKIIICGTMGALFVTLIIVGLVSMKSFHKLEDSAKKEDKLSEEIKKWYLSELNRNTIEEELFDETELADSDEVKYFKRVERIKKMINTKFMNLDPAYVDDMAENIYQEYYENED